MKVYDESIPPARRRLQPAEFSECVHGFDDLKAGDRVVLWCRVSTESQRNNLADQQNGMRQLVVDRGASVADVFKIVGPGTEPLSIYHAARRAEELNGWLLAETTSRFVRHPSFSTEVRSDYQARKTDLEDLMFWAGNARLMTVLAPTADAKAEMSYHRKRGQSQKDRHGGRPKRLNQSRKDRKAAYLDQVIEWHLAGAGIREISRRLRAQKDEFRTPCIRTISNWIHEWNENNQRF